MNTSILDIRLQAEKRIIQMRMVAFAVPIIIIAYLIYIAIAFDFVGVSQKAKLDKASTLIADSYSYKTHVTKSNRGKEQFSIAIEGEKKG